MSIRSLLISVVLSAFTVAPAFAHAGFLVLVSDKSGESGEVTLYATFSDIFPEPEIALRSNAWTIVTPSGGSLNFADIASSNSRTVLRAFLTETGTYRLSTGERLGRTGEIAWMDGQYVYLGADGVARDRLSADARILTSQTATVSDIYLSRGAPDTGPPASRIGRLAIIPAINPASLEPGGTFSLSVEFDGAPLADTQVTVFSPSSVRDEGVPETTRMTDTNGVLHLEALERGLYLVMVRHVAPAPEGAATDVRSYTTTLTLNVNG